MQQHPGGCLQVRQQLAIRLVDAPPSEADGGAGANGGMGRAWPVDDRDRHGLHDALPAAPFVEAGEIVATP